jgi:hypothetical protein
MPYRRLGSTDRLSVAVKDAAGAPADPGDISLKIRDPLGVATTQDYNPGPVARDGVGLFHYDVGGLTTLGTYAYYWKTTGAAQGVSPNLRYFTLVDEWTPLLLTIEEARSQLNVTVGDADLERYVDSAGEAVESRVGPVVPRTVPDVPAESAPPAVPGGRGRLILPHQHVVSVTSATQDGVAVPTTGWTVDGGIVTLPAGQYLSGVVRVVLVAGFDPIPVSLAEAAALRVQHSYETQRGPAELPLSEAAEGGGSAFLLILRAKEKEAPYVPVVVA